MDQERKVMRFGLCVIACALALRLISAAAEPAAKLLSDPKTASFLIYLETGRIIRAPEPTAQTTTPETTVPTEPSLPEAVAVSFQAEDAGLIQVSNFSSYSLDLESLLLTDLTWDLTDEAPTVLILHSHATESYTQAEGYSYEASSAYRTLDTHHNMVRIGQEIANTLESFGIKVIHDTALHDYPSYTDAYVNSRSAAEAYLAQYPSISMVLDIHRDAADLNGTQLDTYATVDGEASTQLMLVVGTDAGGRTHPDWENNMALAVKLHTQLEKRYPGICRPISFRTERFNQDLSAGALLIEVGAAGDTLEEALTAARALARGIADLAAGATADSTS